MSIPLIQILSIGGYIARQTISGNRRYPLVLMLEPLFKCNLSCAGCGKISHPPEVMKRMMPVSDCLDAARECPAPVVSIPGGEPLLHPEIDRIVNGLVGMKRFVYLCTNGVALAERLGDFTPSPYLTFSVHLDGMREVHDRITCRSGVFDAAVDAIRKARGAGFRVTTNTTVYDGATPAETVRFFDFVASLGVEGMTVSPGFVYEGAGEKELFLRRKATMTLFREILGGGGSKRWAFNQSSLYLDFLAGNQDYRCTPWGTPTRNIFGWQRPCYLLGDGYARTWRELMDETDWDRYGHDRNARCADCMVHSGYEATAVMDTVRSPLKAMRVSLRGVRTV